MFVGLILSMFLQAADVPAQPAQTPPPEAAASTSNTQQATAETGENEDATRERRRCSTRQVTGTRLQTVVRCRTGEGHQDEDTLGTLQAMQRPAGTSGN
jgi:hypothetical protein